MLAENARRAASLLSDQEYVRLVSGNGPDALAATAALSHALSREGVDFHVSFLDALDEPRLARIAEEKSELAALIGLPLATPRWASVAGAVVLVDRHAPDDEAHGVVELTARVAGADPAFEASTATLACALAKALNHKNDDLLPLGLAGARVEGQAWDGLRGLNAELLAEALESGALVRTRAPPLDATPAPLFEAVSTCAYPFLMGLSARARVARKWLSELDLPAESPGDAVNAQQAARILSALTLRLVEQQAPDAAIAALTASAYAATRGPLEGVNDHALAHTLAACADTGKPDVGLAQLLLRGGESIEREAENARQEARATLLPTLVRLERDAPAGRGLRAIEAPSPQSAARLAHAVNLAFAGPGPVLAWARDENGVEVRGEFTALRATVQGGPDFGAALHQIAQAHGGWARAHRAGGAFAVPVERFDAMRADLSALYDPGDDAA